MKQVSASSVKPARRAESRPPCSKQRWTCIF